MAHKLTPADVAYATLTYENKSAVWTEDLINKRDGTVIMQAEQKYHIKKGARVKKYCDGWTANGRDYYSVLTTQYKRLWDHQGFHATLVTHWRRYESETNQSTFKRKACEAGMLHSFTAFQSVSWLHMICTWNAVKVNWIVTGL